MKRILTLTLLIISIGGFSQNNRVALEKLIASDSSDAYLLFSYPDTIRTAIFTAATYPQGFTRLNEIQKQSAVSFRKAISTYNKKKQEEWWDLARFPSIFPLLINNKDKSKDELNILLVDYPDDIRKSGIYFVKNDYSTLVSIEKIHQDFESEYKSAINNFPSNVQSSYKRLLLHPELLAILSHSAKATATLGEIYQRDPDLLNYVADSVSNEIAKQDGVAYQEWKKGIYENEKVQLDIKKVSKENISERPSSDDIYDDHQNIESNTTPSSSSNYGGTPPYPYWSGYPYWYTTPYWYPHPWWVQSGFYWNPYYGITLYGVPSYYYGAWYYNYPYHYRRPYSPGYIQQHYQNRPRNNGSYYHRNGGGGNWPGGGGGGRGNGGGGGGGGRRR